MNLYEWQQQAVNEFLNNGKQGIIIGVTGSGKTVCALEAIKQVGEKTLIVVPTIPLLNQWKKELVKYGFLEEDIGLYYGETKVWNKITIAVINSVADKIDLAKRFPLAVFDEVHRYGNLNEDATWSNLLLNNNFRYSLGLTATIEREDGGHELLLDKIGPVIYKYDTKKALREGVIAPFKIICRRIQLPKAQEEKLTRLDAQISSGMRKFDNDFSLVISEVKRRNWDAGRLLKAVSKRKKMYHHSQSKIQEAINIIKDNLDKKIIVFGSYIETADELYKQLKEEGVDPYVYYSGNKDSLFKFNNQDKRDIINNFKKVDSGVLISVKALDEGIDVPDISIGIVLGLTKVSRQAIQRMGRIVRKQQDKEAVMYLFYFGGTRDIDYVISFVNNFRDSAETTWE